MRSSILSFLFKRSICSCDPCFIKNEIHEDTGSRTVDLHKSGRGCNMKVFRHPEVHLDKLTVNEDNLVLLLLFLKWTPSQDDSRYTTQKPKWVKKNPQVTHEELKASLEVANILINESGIHKSPDNEGPRVEGGSLRAESWRERLMTALDACSQLGCQPKAGL